MSRKTPKPLAYANFDLFDLIFLRKQTKILLEKNYIRSYLLLT